MNVGVVVNRPIAAPKQIINCTNKRPENWATSKARAILIKMHMDKIYPVHNISADEVYKIHPEFQLYPFAHSEEDLKNIHAAVEREEEIVRGNENDYLHDELHCPRKEKTPRGEPFWDDHPTNLLLHQDLKDDKEGKKNKQLPSELKMPRKQYKDFSTKKCFSHRIVGQKK